MGYSRVAHSLKEAGRGLGKGQLSCEMQHALPMPLFRAHGVDSVPSSAPYSQYCVPTLASQSRALFLVLTLSHLPLPPFLGTQGQG